MRGPGKRGRCPGSSLPPPIAHRAAFHPTPTLGGSETPPHTHKAINRKPSCPGSFMPPTDTVPAGAALSSGSANHQAGVAGRGRGGERREGRAGQGRGGDGGPPAAGLPGEQCICHLVSNGAAGAERQAHVCPVFLPGRPGHPLLLSGKEPAAGPWMVLHDEDGQEPTEEEGPGRAPAPGSPGDECTCNFPVLLHAWGPRPPPPAQGTSSRRGCTLQPPSRSLPWVTLPDDGSGTLLTVPLLGRGPNLWGFRPCPYPGL